MADSKELQFNRILQEYKRLIYSVCFMFSKDREETKDMYQEVAINLWKGIDSFRNECNMKTWVYRISFNTCISFERKKKRAVFLPISTCMDVFEEDNTTGKQIELLYNRISRLAPFDRAIILLWLEAMPYQEIADIVGTTIKNVSVRLSRIRELLKSMK